MSRFVASLLYVRAARKKVNSTTHSCFAHYFERGRFYHLRVNNVVRRARKLRAAEASWPGALFTFRIRPAARETFTLCVRSGTVQYTLYEVVFKSGVPCVYVLLAALCSFCILLRFSARTLPYRLCGTYVWWSLCFGPAAFSVCLASKRYRIFIIDHSRNQAGNVCTISTCWMRGKLDLF